MNELQSSFINPRFIVSTILELPAADKLDQLAGKAFLWSMITERRMGRVVSTPRQSLPLLPTDLDFTFCSHLVEPFLSASSSWNGSYFNCEGKVLLPRLFPSLKFIKARGTRSLEYESRKNRLEIG